MSEPKNKIELTLIKTFVTEMSDLLQEAERLEEDHQDPAKFVMTLSKAYGVATQAAIECAALAGDFHRVIQKMNGNLPATSSKEDPLATLMASLKKPGVVN